MDRLTKRLNGSACRNECYGPCSTCDGSCGLHQPVIDRLAAIEDILGDYYDLDELQELIEAGHKWLQANEKREEGKAKARARGKKFGRPKMERPAGYEERKRLYLSGQLSSSKHAARPLGVAHTTFLRWIKEDAKNGK